MTWAGPSEEPQATPSICLYIPMMKVNSTDIEAAVFNLVKNVLGTVGGTNSLLYKVSAQI